MTTAAALEAQLSAARVRSCEVEPGVTLQYEIPGAFRAQQMVDAMRASDGERIADLMAPLVKGWTGVTDATLLGASVGGSDPAPISEKVVRLTLADRPAWIIALAMHMIEQAGEQSQKLRATQGN